MKDVELDFSDHSHTVCLVQGLVVAVAVVGWGGAPMLMSKIRECQDLAADILDMDVCHYNEGGESPCQSLGSGRR